VKKNIMLSKNAFERSRKFIEEKGRPLEAARLRFHFDRVPARQVVAELEKFQNDDGGFGKALEPDLRTPESSALGTSIAFQIFREIGRDAAEGIASSAIRYLLNSFDDKKMVWRIVPTAAEKSPHAPWWTQAGLEKSFNAFLLNPTAELLGSLFDYRKDVPQALLSSLSDEILVRLGALDKIEMHDFLCCKRLAETENLAASFKVKLVDHLARLLDGVVSREPSQWAMYGLKPLQVADRPQSPFFEMLRDVIAENLDYELATQQEDGSWPVTWSWGDTFPDDWEKAKVEWAGVLTVEKLLTLKRYGRIEGLA
jgi:hypothetical protein